MNKYIIKALSDYKFDFTKNLGYGIINGYEVNVYNNPFDVGPIFYFSTYLSENNKNEFVSKINQKQIAMVFGGTFEFGVTIQIGAFTSKGFEKKFSKVLPIILEILSELGALKNNVCPQTGVEFAESARIVVVSKYKINVKLSIEGIKNINDNYNNQPNNYFLGFLGLLLGGLVGAVCAYVFYRVGITCSFASAIAIILGVNLYKKFGGKPNTVMVLMSLFITLICIFLPSFLRYIRLANNICKESENSLLGFKAFSYCLSTNHDFYRMFKVEFISNIVFTLYGIILCMISLVKNVKRPTKLK